MVKDSLMLSEEDDTDSEIERIINQKNDQDDEYQETAISTNVQTRKTTHEPLINQSDSDEDDFIRMLKRK